MQYDRVENTMDNRQCLYHKGSPVKTGPGSKGTVETDPQAYTWSCCGGNGIVRGCCRAMHTTKKKRVYGKKRNADEARLDGDDDDDGEDSGVGDKLHILTSNAYQEQQQINETELEHTTLNSPDPRRQHRDQHFDNRLQLVDQASVERHAHQYTQQPILPSQPAIDTRLQEIAEDLQPDTDLSPSQMLLLGQQLQEYNQSANTPLGYPQLPPKRDSDSPMSAHPGIEQIAQHLAQTQPGAQLPPEYRGFAPAQDIRLHG